MQPRNLPQEAKIWIKQYLDELEPNVTVVYKKIIKLLRNEMNVDGDFGLFVRNDAQMNKIRSEHWMDKNPELWDKIENLITSELF